MLIDDAVAELGSYEARAVRSRVAGAIADRRVSDLLHPKPAPRPDRPKARR